MKEICLDAYSASESTQCGWSIIVDEERKVMLVATVSIDWLMRRIW